MAGCGGEALPGGAVCLEVQAVIDGGTVDQNRDAQMFQLLKLDLPADQVGKLRSVRHYDGLPIDARSITDDIRAQEGN